MNYFSRRFNIKVPRGCLYYPCCGNDIARPLELFFDTISEFHFADIKNITLPNEELKGKLGQYRYIYDYINENIVKNITHSTREIDRNLLEKKKVALREITQNIQIPRCQQAYIKKNTWLINIESQIREINIIRHKKDALLTLSELENIAVFYYCGDSLGEGGSGQWWLGPQIFSMVLDRLADGGIIVTDGSNPDPDLRNIQENKPLWKNSWLHKSQSHRTVEPEDFTYQGRKFKLIGQCGHKHGPVYAWRVTRI